MLTSLKDAIFAVFFLIASRRTLKNLTGEATQNVKAQQWHRKSEVVKKFIYFGEQASQFIAGHYSLQDAKVLLG